MRRSKSFDFGDDGCAFLVERDKPLGEFCKSGVGVRHQLLRSYSISICRAGVRAFLPAYTERQR
jgi:hypothetical protein